jgi:hypothetical protein
VFVVAVLIATVGLTQVYATERWQAYYHWLSRQGLLGVRLNGLVSLAIGGPIIILHNIWTGPGVLLTLFGWMLVIESALCLIFPGAGLAGLIEIEDAVRARILRFTGFVLIVIGGVLLLAAVRPTG